jgi:alpha-tubulin suppressor-like RCC1 family protein
MLAAGLAVTTAAAPAVASARPSLHPLPTRSEAVSWGINSYGELGGGTTDLGRSLPGAVNGLSRQVVSVAAGEYHGMALTADGSVWTWGGNQSGQLGYDTGGGSSPDPALVPGLSGITQITAGYQVSYALRSDGTVWAWGDNQHGELGNGAAGAPSPVPVQVSGLAGVTQLAAGFEFALALRSDGTVWGWGADQQSVLGTGAGRAGGVSATPVQIAGLARVTRIAAALDTGMAVAARRSPVPTVLNEVYTWGGDSDGDLGDGGDGDGDGGVPQVVPGLPQVTTIAAGSESAFAVGADGSVWAWGNDRSGQLGNAPAATPVLTPKETLAPGSGIIQISTGGAPLIGYDHTLARRADGTVLAFGDNRRGELGTGGTSPVAGPTPVSGLAGVTQVAAGGFFSLAADRVLALPGPLG